VVDKIVCKYPKFSAMEKMCGTDAGAGAKIERQMEFPAQVYRDSDFEAVDDLIEECKEQLQEMEDLRVLTSLWLTAFKVFRKKERLIGLPESDRDRRFYSAALNGLRSFGKLLECKIDGHDPEDVLPKSVSLQDFQSMLHGLYLSDKSNEEPLTSSAVSDLEQLFGVQ